METYEILGTFSDNVKIFHYPSASASNKVFLVLKGIYGEHIPGNSSWDNELVTLLHNEYHLIFIRTSRQENKTDKEAFSGKTFEQECREVKNAFEFCRKKLFSGNYTWNGLGVSFGGTVLLGTPFVLLQMKKILMVGSGCGKNSGTIKPLLSSLPETENLLNPLDEYHGSFIFLHGEDDTIVPKDSQSLIYNRAKHSSPHEWHQFKNMDHGLHTTNTKESHLAKIVSSFMK